MSYLSNLPNKQTQVFSFLDLIYATNHGISFGIFSNFAASNTIFLVLNSLIIIYIYCLLFRATTIGQILGYCLVVGGALGNIFDRVFHGFVFDFLYFHYDKYGFAVFNLADSFIFIGVMILIYYNYKLSSSSVNKIL